ncbi:hypothetical protein AQI88_20860 [Streptomyces cellostaticus]|uniref:ABC transporter domain-containing protein n=1 Tax=Streptomyces cellostaticus TaxID=67285 RepID=A0A101NJS7_9ACTN|nr:ATP-binding cassette domain-containing protein [Streptomyces cellostaticus]KUM94633.1 hypothetical protein AQI88_20860 [Streptomyces cellostaticus]GHI07339.1 hypothetical protein Scel_56600 [Streptomyces cellostaticus]
MAEASVAGATIELENLPTRYPGHPQPAVDNVSMEIKAGETVIFVGPSGCGKSATLKMINRLTEPTGGRIRIDGEDVTAIDAVRLRRKVGYAIRSRGDRIAVPRERSHIARSEAGRLEAMEAQAELEEARAQRTHFEQECHGGEEKA